MSKAICTLKAQIEELKFVEVSRMTDEDLLSLEAMTEKLTRSIESHKLWRGDLNRNRQRGTN